MLRRFIALIALTGFVLGLAATVTAFATCDDGLLASQVKAFSPYHRQCNPAEIGIMHVGIVRTIFLTFTLVAGLALAALIIVQGHDLIPDSAPRYHGYGPLPGPFRPPGMKPYDQLLDAFRSGIVQHGSSDA
ncbi:MAG: hypothetical protein HY976_00385 [Candidatus Kerfeldbacteria bacterium]|nr:hypothetical protein [Candidatus Kerfeldbacteria bacterium]